MATYQYAATDPCKACAHCRAGFEVQQRMSDKPLSACPLCGAPVKRVITPVGISTHRPSRRLLSDKSLKQHGFTKLINEGEGRFRKV